MANEFQDYRANLIDTDIQLYRNSAGRSEYIRDEGLLVIPVMGPSTQAPVVVRVHAPYGVRRAKFFSEKSHIPPLFPPQADTDSGDVILTSSLHFSTPAPGPDGALVFRVGGEYSYVQPGSGRGPDSTYPMDRHPFPTAIDRIDVLPPPSESAFNDMNWHYNCSYYDARLYGSYNLIG